MVRASPKARLLVYGTLMRGHPAHRILSELPGSRYMARAWAHGRLLDLGDYPGAVLDPRSRARFEGELWEADYRPGMFRELDAYEGFSPARPDQSLFVRARARALSVHGATRAWIYVVRAPSPSAPVIEAGVWSPGSRQGAPRVA